MSRMGVCQRTRKPESAVSPKPATAPYAASAVAAPSPETKPTARP
jgi:hypothetical protein